MYGISRSSVVFTWRKSLRNVRRNAIYHIDTCCYVSLTVCFAFDYYSKLEIALALYIHSVQIIKV